MNFTKAVFAAGWVQEGAEWWYQNENGSYPMNQWQWIDGNRDGIAECYYFDSDGYLLVNTMTPDGYRVGQNGAWVVNHVIQTQQIAQTQREQKKHILTKEEGIDILTNYMNSQWRNGYWLMSEEDSNDNQMVAWEHWNTGMKGKVILDLQSGDCYREEPYEGVNILSEIPLSQVFLFNAYDYTME